MKENQALSVIILTMGQALNAGFVPDGPTLRHKSGATVQQATLSMYSGKIMKAVGTGNAEFPVVVDGQILHKSLVSIEKSRKSMRKANGRQYDLVSFDNGATYVSVPGYDDLPIDEFDLADAAKSE